MQYLLTEEEFYNLVPREELDETNKAIDKMRVLFIGDDCIHSGKKRDVYCDNCPLAESRFMCRLEKSWSK